MNENEFIELVAKMRDAQKQYFKTRDSFALKAAKGLEKQVDIVTARYDNAMSKNKPLLNPTLF